MYSYIKVPGMNNFDSLKSIMLILCLGLETWLILVHRSHLLTFEYFEIECLCLKNQGEFK